MKNYTIKLYIIGHTLPSIKALQMMNSICADHLKDDCDIEIIDIEKDPDRAEVDGILTIPTLIRKWPQPEIRLIGALSVKTRILTGLGISVEEI